MELLRQTINDIASWIFLSFGIFIPAVTFVTVFVKGRVRSMLNDWSARAVGLVRWAGVASLLVWLAGLYASGEDAVGWQALTDRLAGPYAFWYWFYVITFTGVPQLFWIKRIRQSELARVVVAIFILVVTFFGRFVILMTSIHRDYVPSSWPVEQIFDFRLVMLFYIVKTLLFIVALAVLKSVRSEYFNR